MPGEPAFALRRPERPRRPSIFFGPVATMLDHVSPMTVPKFAALKGAGQKITMLTAYDYTMAGLLDATGIEGILVGDSLSMVVQGHSNTLPVTLDETIYHAEMVGRAVRQALVVVDLPFPSYHLGKYKAVAAAGRILKETRCQAVKLEGGVEQAEVIAASDRGRHSRDGPLRTAAAERASTRRLQGAAQWPAIAGRRPRRAGRGGLCGGAGMHSGRAGRGDHRRTQDSHHRHRCRGGLRRPGAGDQRSVGHHQRVRAAVRQTVCRPQDGDQQAVGNFRDDVRQGKFPGAEQSFR